MALIGDIFSGIGSFVGDLFTSVAPVVGLSLLQTVAGTGAGGTASSSSSNAAISALIKEIRSSSTGPQVGIMGIAPQGPSGAPAIPSASTKTSVSEGGIERIYSDAGALAKRIASSGNVGKVKST